MNLSKRIKLLIESTYGGIMVDTSLRYLPVVSLIKRNNLSSLRILEVGSGSDGLTQYLPILITGADIRFDKVGNPFLEKVKASIIDLPFKNNDFDVVIAVDVLEHIESAQRRQAVHELIRVAKKLIIINSPVGRQSYLQDVRLQAKHLEIFKKEHPSLKEHIRAGPVIESEIRQALLFEAKSFGKKLKIRIVPNLNLACHWILMRSWITKSRILHFLDRTLWVILIPVISKLNFRPCYRKMFVIRIG